VQHRTQHPLRWLEVSLRLLLLLLLLLRLLLLLLECRQVPLPQLAPAAYQHLSCCRHSLMPPPPPPQHPAQTRSNRRAAPAGCAGACLPAC
jgi:hypothetical protein